MYIVGRSSAHHYRIKKYIYISIAIVSYIQESTYVYDDDDDEKKRIEIIEARRLLCFVLLSAAPFSTYYHHHIILFILTYYIYILSLAVAIFSGCVF